MNRPRMRPVVAGVMTAALLAGLGACAEPSDLSDAAAAELQDAVAGVVAAAEDGRYDEALASAATVRSELEQAADAGQLSVERYRRIDEALTRTEAELTAALVAASATPATDDAAEEPVAPAPEGRPGEQDGPGAGDGEKPGNGRGRDRGNGGERGRGGD